MLGECRLGKQLEGSRTEERMGLGVQVEKMLQTYRQQQKLRLSGPIGDWHCAGGDEQLWTGLPLCSEDLVLDVGGYEGRWTSEILVRYGCRSVIFEPIPDALTTLKKYFVQNDRVEIVEAGLGDKTQVETMSILNDGSSTFERDPVAQTIPVSILGVADFFQRKNLEDVACMKINIEGGEYRVLEKMIVENLHYKVQYFLIQFHSFVVDCEERREKIQQCFSDSHEKIFDYPFVWECWKKK